MTNDTHPHDPDAAPISLRSDTPTSQRIPAGTPAPNQTVLLVITAVIFTLVGMLLAAGYNAIGSGDSDAGDAGDIDAIVEARVGTRVAELLPSPTPTVPPPTPMPVAMTADDDAFLGAEDAPVVIVEFSDFQCGYCGRWYYQTLPQILDAYPDQVKFIYRDFPIFGEESVRAAMATECAEEQGKFWDMHNIIFEKLGSDDRPPLSHDNLVMYAGELNMDEDAFSACLASERYISEISNDFQDAQAYGFGGTPGFVINGVVYAFGAQPFEVFDEIIQRELAGQGAS